MIVIEKQLQYLHACYCELFLLSLSPRGGGSLCDDDMSLLYVLKEVEGGMR